MKSKLKRIALVLLCIICLYSTFSIAQEINRSTPSAPLATENENENENVELHFPISNESTGEVSELNAPAPVADLRDPENIQSNIEYDPVSGNYIIRSQVGGEDINKPYVLNSEEFKNYSMQKSMQDYWMQKNAAEHGRDGEDDKFNPLDIKVDFPRGDQIFGPGGIQVKTQGSAELSFGFRKNKTDNPTLTERSRNPPATFDFDEKIQLSVRGSVGDRIGLALNYNTEASFDFDQKLIKLSYEGKEDDILQKLEAGNVSLPLNSSLIPGSTALFGVLTQLKFGRLTVDAVISQQESESQTVSMRNGAQTTPFEVNVDDYDENRHFFLAQYFRDNYDKAMSTLPYINSPIKLNRVEVWVTNKRGNFDDARNIVAFADLAEHQKIYNTTAVHSTGALNIPYNNANDLYVNMSTDPAVREMDLINSALEGRFEGGVDYEKIGSARLLNSSEYTVNYDLGYISLKAALSSDEVLGVAYEYTYRGTTYQVGEFATDIRSAAQEEDPLPDEEIDENAIRTMQNLIVKLIKPTNLSPYPQRYTWDLMMKNVYSIGGYQIEQDRFELNVMYQSDSTGVYLNYLPNSPIDSLPLVRVMNLDRLDSHNESRSDGFFDFVEGYTIIASTGRIIFPVVEPFGSHLRTKLNRGNEVVNPAYEKFIYQELYDSTLVVAREYSEKNKFRLRGKYKGSSGSEIRLNAMNVPRGSVTVTAGGRKLTENVDYTVDYNMGTVTIMNQDILDSGTSIDVSLENQSYFNTQRKSLMGVHLDYKFNEDFRIGGTLMHLSEKPLTQKVNMGTEPISNTMWGVDMSYKTQSQWLTNMLDKIPLLKLSEPSSIAFNGEFAQLIPGTNKVIDNYAYIDDFEAAKMGIDIRTAYSWKLASTPDVEAFPEAKLNNNVSYGQNRALLAWYTIDPLFNQRRDNTPGNVWADADLRSNHFVREIDEREIFPNRDQTYGQSSKIVTLNLSYYPEERGPYNLSAKGIDPTTGKLTNPGSRWGGIMRRLETSDFETQNIEYIEFWMMDPFVYDRTVEGGDLYFNLGDISEDILKDGKKSFESGFADEAGGNLEDDLVWGQVPKKESIGTFFATDDIAVQDIGLDGLTDDQEKAFESYRVYRDSLLAKIPAGSDIYQQYTSDPFSPLNDPAGDNYHYYLGGDFDDLGLNTLERYKHYNGVQGNSIGGSTAATSLPDMEDINSDNTMNEYERFYQYKVPLRPGEMRVGQNYIVDSVNSVVELPNGEQGSVSWYQFKIPINSPTNTIGGLRNNFKSIRFIRMYMTGFEQETHLRFATLELVRGEWRKVTKDLRYDITEPTNANTVFDVSAVNIEENSSKQPIRYVLPPGIDRVIDPSQTQIRQENEQSMLMKVENLAPRDSRAVYKNIAMDMRQYKRLQMFVHTEQLLDDNTNLQNGELTLFLRLGSDHTNNFYEYEVPLRVTPNPPSGSYSPNIPADVEAIWPAENMFDFPLDVLVNAKTERNRQMNSGNPSFTMAKSPPTYDGSNKITVVGNPSISDVQVIMIGVRNGSSETKTGEIWVNELRLKNFDEDGGWAAMANVVVNLSDLGTVAVSGRTETSGFGSIEQSVMGRSIDDIYQVNFATGLELGRFFPEKAKLRIPFYYSASREVISPKYNPLDQDVLLTDALDATENEHMRDSIKELSQNVTTSKSVSFSNVKVDIQSERPQFYDPSNFSVGYTYNEVSMHDPETEYEVTKTHRGVFNYMYTTSPKPFEPFVNAKFLRAKSLRLIRDFNVNYIPSYIAYSNNIDRYYYELQVRDLTGTNKLPVSFRQDFTWGRQFDLKYDFSRSLKFTLATATNSRIDEPYDPVNKDLYPDEYQHWKDSVWSNIMKFGRPITYQQIFTGDYNIPLNKIPFLDWMTARTQYNSTYNWERGVVSKGDGFEIDLGNTATNIHSWQFDGRLNLETLYKKSSYLAKVNNRFSARRPTKETAPPQSKKYSEKVSLKANEKKEVRHRLNSADIEVTITDATGKAYPVKYKRVDNNTISLKTKEDVNGLNINVATVIKKETPGKYASDVLVRALMMVRNVSGTYKQTNSLILPGYNPTTGFLGQDGYNGTRAPGYDFVFGFYNSDNYVKKAQSNGWLMYNDSISNPLAMNKIEDLQLRATVEPFRSFKIELNAFRTSSETSSIQFYEEGPVSAFNGTFTMTQVAIGTSLWKIGTGGNFDSRAYNEFLMHRSIMAERIERQYVDKPEGLSYNPNSSDVLIPAFLAAYTNKNPSKSPLDIFPSIWKMLPNWRITYNGLSNVEFLKKHFRSINLMHAYRCTYNVGSYSSLLNWQSYYDDPNMTNGHYGYTNNIIDGSRMLSSQYDVGSVTIIESFSPLLGVDVTMNNSVSIKVEYKRARTLTLSVPSVQLIESFNNEWVFGAGYKITDFNKIIRIKQRQSTVSNDLTLRGDISIKDIKAIIRRIEDNYSQPTSGSKALTLRFTADYIFNEKVNIGLYYDRMTNTPFVSSSYPTVSSDFGITFRFLLTR